MARFSLNAEWLPRANQRQPNQDCRRHVTVATNIAEATKKKPGRPEEKRAEALFLSKSSLLAVFVGKVIALGHLNGSEKVNGAGRTTGRSAE